MYKIVATSDSNQSINREYIKSLSSISLAIPEIRLIGLVVTN